MACRCRGPSGVHQPRNETHQKSRQNQRTRDITHHTPGLRLQGMGQQRMSSEAHLQRGTQQTSRQCLLHTDQHGRRLDRHQSRSQGTLERPSGAHSRAFCLQTNNSRKQPAEFKKGSCNKRLFRVAALVPRHFPSSFSLRISSLSQAS